MSYSADSFSAGEQPTTAKWNKLWSNDASFNDGTGIAADAITDSKLVYGKLRSRQGGSATDWTSPGTTTYDYSATNTFMQAGTKTLTAQTTTITFPTAFSQKPIIMASPNGGSGVFSAGWYVVTITTTSFDFVAADYPKATPLMWIAIGE